MAIMAISHLQVTGDMVVNNNIVPTHLHLKYWALITNHMHKYTYLIETMGTQTSNHGQESLPEGGPFELKSDLKKSKTEPGHRI